MEVDLDTDGDITVPTNLLDLPDECLELIFNKLSSPCQRKLSSTCSRFNYILQATKYSRNIYLDLDEFRSFSIPQQSAAYDRFFGKIIKPTTTAITLYGLKPPKIFDQMALMHYVPHFGHHLELHLCHLTIPFTSFYSETWNFSTIYLKQVVVYGAVDMSGYHKSVNGHRLWHHCRQTLKIELAELDGSELVDFNDRNTHLKKILQPFAPAMSTENIDLIRALLSVNWKPREKRFFSLLCKRYGQHGDIHTIDPTVMSNFALNELNNFVHILHDPALLQKYSR